MKPAVDVYRSSNPFRSANIRPGANSFVFGERESLTELFEKLQKAGGGQIIGPHGSGKSTLLLALLEFAAGQGWNFQKYTLDGTIGARVSIFDVLAMLRATPQTNLIAVDGFDQLASWQRKLMLIWCKRNCTALLVTSHQDMGLAVLHRTRVDFQVADEVIRNICDREQVAMRPPATRLSNLLVRHGENLREVLFTLYDEYQAAT